MDGIKKYFKPIPINGDSNSKSKDETDSQANHTDDLELKSHNDLMDDNETDETDSFTSIDSADLVRRNKRKRICDYADTRQKRRSEEPLVKLKVVDETSAQSDITKKIDLKQTDGVTESEKCKAVEEHKTDDQEKSEDEEQEEFEVEKIVDYRYDKKTEEGLYLVKWIGWDETGNTWEPTNNLDCREKLVEFYNERLEQRKVSTSSEKRLLPLPPDPRDRQDLRELFTSKFYSRPSQSVLEKLYKSQKKNKLPKMLPEPILKREMEVLAISAKANEKRVERVRTQLNMRELDRHRDRQKLDLKNWEETINRIEKDAHVSVINEVDLEGPPTMMEYINSYKAGDGIIIPDDPLIGCECENCGSKSADCCPRGAGYEMAYTPYGKLRVDIGYPIYECNKWCKCPPSCKNRVVQKGRTVKLAIYRTDNGCGWGVKALEKIKEGSFVVQYVGEVITSDEAEQRGKKYDADGRTYLFDLDFNLGDENPYTVDAAFFGNLSHFINHSCEPNLSIFNVFINCLDPNLPLLCLFARRDIQKGEQLTFDYCQSTQSAESEGGEGTPRKTPQKGIVSPRVTTPATSLGSSAKKAVVKSPVKSTKKAPMGQENKTECRCGSKNCRKVLF